MKLSLLLTGLITLIVAYFTETTSVNRLNASAEKAYHLHHYKIASELYDSLIAHYKIKNEAALLNKASSLYYLNDFDGAQRSYMQLTKSENEEIRSTAWNQIGLIKYFNGKEKEALNCLKMSISENPSNNIAVYNYELLIKTSRENQEVFIKNQRSIPESVNSSKGTKKQEQPVPSQNGKEIELPGGDRKTDQEGNLKGDGIKSNGKNGLEQSILQNTENTGTTQNKKQDEQGRLFKNELVSEKLKSKGIPPERAKQILNAMKNEEIRYLQQLKHSRKSIQKNKDIPEY